MERQDRKENIWMAAVFWICCTCLGSGCMAFGKEEAAVVHVGCSMFVKSKCSCALVYIKKNIKRSWISFPTPFETVQHFVILGQLLSQSISCSCCKLGILTNEVYLCLILKRRWAFRKNFSRFFWKMRSQQWRGKHVWWTKCWFNKQSLGSVLLGRRDPNWSRVQLWGPWCCWGLWWWCLDVHLTSAS